MALTETYVDPSIAGNSGTGTVGDPYGDLQYALDTMTRDATNGDRINVKAGTAELLTATLDLTTYGTPASTAPLKFQGYTSAAGDGGMGDIDGNSNAVWNDTTTDFVGWEDLYIHDSGSNRLFKCDNGFTFVNCGFWGSTYAATAVGVLLECDLNTHIEKCFFNLDDGGSGNGHAVRIVQGEGRVRDSVFRVTRTSATCAGLFSSISSPGSIENCIAIVASGATGGQGFVFSNDLADVRNCSVFSEAASVKAGIEMSSVSAADRWTCVGNLVEGFSGTGGHGIKSATTPGFIGSCAHNAMYNNDTDIGLTAAPQLGEVTDNESLGSSPFAKTGSIPTDFTSATFWSDLRAYFAPNDVGNVRTGAGAITTHKGAVPPAAGGGGGMMRAGWQGGFGG